MERNLKGLLGGVSALALGVGLLVPVETEAQTAALPGGVTAVQQSAARADAASFSASITAANCTTSQITTAAGTLTISPPAGNFAYLANLVAMVANNSTGALSQAALSTTNLTGSPAFLVAEQAAALSGVEQVNVVWPTGLKSQTAGTNVTVVPTATLASAYLCVQASGWYSPI